MIVNCEDCDESICSDCDGERVGPGRYVCLDCLDEREELEEEAEQANLPASAAASYCCVCGTVTKLYIEKIEGVHCVSCAHELELKLLGGEHDAASCPICTPQVKAA